MGNWGVHYLDAIRWILNEEAPSSLYAMGGRYAVEDDRTIPDTMKTTFEFASGHLATFGQFEACGNPAIRRPEIEFRGTKASGYIDPKSYEILPERGGLFQNRKSRCEPQLVKDPQNNHRMTVEHTRDFLDCIKSRQLPRSDIETGHRSTSFSLLANISLAVGERLDWDAEKERFTNSEEANKMLHYEYRKPWKLG